MKILFLITLFISSIHANEKLKKIEDLIAVITSPKESKTLYSKNPFTQRELTAQESTNIVLDDQDIKNSIQIKELSPLPKIQWIYNKMVLIDNVWYKSGEMIKDRKIMMIDQNSIIVTGLEKPEKVFYSKSNKPMFEIERKNR